MNWKVEEHKILQIKMTARPLSPTWYCRYLWTRLESCDMAAPTPSSTSRLHNTFRRLSRDCTMRATPCALLSDPSSPIRAKAVWRMGTRWKVRWEVICKSNENFCLYDHNNKLFVLSLLFRPLRHKNRVVCDYSSWNQERIVKWTPSYSSPVRSKDAEG